jgi:hypothetical protein
MYRTALSKKLGMSQWFQIPVWGDLIGHIGGMNEYGYPRSVPYGATKGRKLKPTGKVVEVLTDWFHQGGWDIDIPMLLPLTEDPVVGDDQAKGNEEDRKWVYNKAYITQVRKPAKISDGAMGDLAINPDYLKQMWNNLHKDFSEFNMRLQAYSPYDAIYRGFDNQLIRSKELPDCVQKSHPNFYIEGFGKVPYNANNTTYETAIAAQLANLGAEDKMTMKTLRKMQMAANEHMIVPPTMTVLGHQIKGICIMNDRQFAQLAEDPLFEKVHIALITKDGNQAALFTGAYEVHLVEGVLILVDVNNPGIWLAGDDPAYDATKGIINYGNPHPLKNPVHNSDIKVAIFLGASAILCGTTKQLQFKNETDDYENVRGEASITVVGYNRADRINADRKVPDAEHILNSSSLVVATYTPQNIAWQTQQSS